MVGDWSIDGELYQELVQTGLCVPLTRFCARLTPLESITLYLSSERSVPLSDIAVLTNRPRATILNAYKSAQKKSVQLSPSPSPYRVPVRVLLDSRLSPGEAVIAHLREYYLLPYATIAKLIGKDARNVLRVYRSSVEKREVQS